MKLVPGTKEVEDRCTKDILASKTFCFLKNNSLHVIGCSFQSFTSLTKLWSNYNCRVQQHLYSLFAIRKSTPTFWIISQAGIPWESKQKWEERWYQRGYKSRTLKPNSNNYVTLYCGKFNNNGYLLIIHFSCVRLYVNLIVKVTFWDGTARIHHLWKNALKIFCNAFTSKLHVVVHPAWNQVLVVIVWINGLCRVLQSSHQILGSRFVAMGLRTKKVAFPVW